MARNRRHPAVAIKRAHTRSTTLQKKIDATVAATIISAQGKEKLTTRV